MVIHIKNSGQTPAYNMQVIAISDISSFPFKNGYPPTQFGNSALTANILGGSAIKDAQVVIGPGETTAIQLNVPKPTIMQTRLIFAKKSVRYIVSAVYYNDIFGDTHFTKYCWYAENMVPETAMQCRVGNGAN